MVFRFPWVFGGFGTKKYTKQRAENPGQTRRKEREPREIVGEKNCEEITETEHYSRKKEPTNRTTQKREILCLVCGTNANNNAKYRLLGCFFVFCFVFFV